MKVAATALLALLCACVPVDQSAASLRGEWRVAAVNGRETPSIPGAYRIEWRDGSVRAQFGCNHGGSTYRVRGTILYTDAMVMTEMACPGPADRFEAEGFAILSRPMRISRTDPNSMSLANERGTIALTRN